MLWGIYGDQKILCVLIVRPLSDTELVTFKTY